MSAFSTLLTHRWTKPVTWRVVAVIGLVGAGSSPVLAATCVPATTTDWMATSNLLAAPIRPADCSVVTQSPPDFGWPDVNSSASYQITLIYPDGRSVTKPATQNWINWPELLPAGDYSWRVTMNVSGTTSTSQTRRFTVDASARPFVVPDPATMYSRITAKPHPRALPDASTLSTMAAQRQAGLSSLLRNADAYLTSSLPAQPSSTSAGSNWSVAHDECKRALNSGLAYVLTKQTKYLTDATRRLRNLASWSPTGPTGYYTAGMDMGAREITWTMALLYDWLYPQLDSTTRSQVLSVLNTRTGHMYNDVIGTRSRLARSPRDSHGSLTVYIVGAIAAILAGDLPVAQTWLYALQQSANAVSPWGDDDSGHANGTTQGSWDMGDSLVPWYVFRWAGGIDIAQKAWMRNWSNFIVYNLPPGTPSGLWGDGAEGRMTENWARFGKAATWFAPTPLGRWYISQSQLQGDDPSRIEVMLAPPADFSTASFPAGTSNAAVFRGVGWAAFHSDLSNPARVSLYFKSSPYGSFNHSHGDQNSFVVNAGGQRLAIDSGYYDDYKTAHWYNWYKQTKAHNAITFDGGQGQTIFEQSDRMGPGQLTGWVRGSGYEIIYGDATAAYAGALTRAHRAIAYFPPNLAIVYDTLASGTARTWEWNIHSLTQMSSASSTRAMITTGGQSLCVTVLGGPPVAFSQSSAFTSNPTGSWSPQWHGKFSTTSKLNNAEFVTLLNVGCTATTATATQSGSTWTVNLGNRSMTLANGVVTVGGGGTTTTTSTTAPAVTTTTLARTTTTTLPPTTPPPPTGTSAPFSGTPINLPATLEAENFDLGGQGVAYRDTTTGNAGGQYRTNDSVDIVASCDPSGGGYVVNNFATGEWMSYTVNVPTTGTYDIAVRAASNYATGAFHVEVDNQNVTGSIGNLNTGGWCTFQWFGRTGVPLTAGRHVLKLVADAQYFNVNQIRVMASTTTPTTPTTGGRPYGGTPIAVPATFEAENFDLGGEGVAYRDTTTGNAGGLYRTNDNVDIISSCDAGGGAYVVNNFATGEWMNYTISVPTAGNYDIAIRAASNYPSSSFHFEVDGVRVSDAITGLYTNSWCTFQWIGKTGVPLSAGTHTLRLHADAQYFNVNQIRVLRTP